MKDYSLILFDLDGTLTESHPGIVNSVVYALKHYGLPVPEYSELLKFVGPPLAKSFTEFAGMSEEQAKEAVFVYREYFSTKGLFENAPYEGIAEVLGRLKAAGKRLAVATSKPDVFSEKILRHFGLMDYFDFLAGAAMDEKSRLTKTEVIEYALENCGVTDRSRVLMVGDRSHDILGAKAAGLDSAGVLYGYGSREELEEAGADYIFETVADLLKLI